MELDFYCFCLFRRFIFSDVWWGYVLVRAGVHGRQWHPIIRLPGAGVTGGCELPILHAGSQTQVFWKRGLAQHVRTAEPSLQSLVFSIVLARLEHLTLWLSSCFVNTVLR